MFDFTKASNLYTDSARTTLVTASGDLIGSASDLSPNGKHASSAGTARPTWSSAGYATFDAFDDYLQTAAIDFSGSNKITAIASATNTATAQAVLLELGDMTQTINAGGVGLQVPQSAGKYRTNLRYTGGGLVQFDFTKSSGTNVVTAFYDFTAPTDPGKLTLRENGVGQAATVNTTSPQVATNGANTALNIASRIGTSLFFAGNLYRLLVIGRALTTTERNAAERWAAQPVGIAIP